MINAWFELWKNTFNYKGKMTRKSYWLALITNLIAMYVFVVPYALILRNFTTNILIVIPYLVIIHLPVISAYFRRANDAGFHVVTTIYLVLVIPIISGLFVGIFPSVRSIDKGRGILGKLLALGFGLFLYGGFLGILIYDDPSALPYLPISGLIINSLSLIIYGIINWRDVLAFFGIDLRK